MERNRRESVLAIGVVTLFMMLGLLVAGGCSTGEQTTTDEAAAEEPQSEEASHEVAYLLVQSSRGFEYDGKRMTVTGTSPSTIYFSDRPDRIAGHMPLEAAYDWARPSFAEDPPNAVLSILDEGEPANVVVTLKNPTREGSSISWDVDISKA